MLIIDRNDKDLKTYFCSLMKSKKYKNSILQIETILLEENDNYAALANVSAILHMAFSFWWTGFYLVKNENEENILVIAPFQGPAACSRIKFGKGVCGTAWKTKKSIIIKSVHEIENHISCSEFSNSEIVVPIISNGNVKGVLDIDSKLFSNFDETDKKYLEKVCNLISKKYWP